MDFIQALNDYDVEDDSDQLFSFEQQQYEPGCDTTSVSSEQSAASTTSLNPKHISYYDFPQQQIPSIPKYASPPEIQLSPSYDDDDDNSITFYGPGPERVVPEKQPHVSRGSSTSNHSSRTRQPKTEGIFNLTIQKVYKRASLKQRRRSSMNNFSR